MSGSTRSAQGTDASDLGEEAWGEAGGGNPSTAVARVEPKILIPRPARVVNGSAVEALESAIADLDHDRATLARAKEILEARG